MAVQLSGSLSLSGSLTTTGQIIAQTINVQQVTSSIVYSSGSNIFGNSLANTQIMTGSVLVTGSLTVSGPISGTGTTQGTIVYGSTAVCSPIGCFATSCATSFIGGTGYYSSQICSTGNSNTFGAAGSPGRALIVQAGCTNQAIMFKNCSGGDGTIFVDGTLTSLDYKFNTYSTGDAFVIKNGGNIGIGTSSPAVKLHVSGSGTTYGKIEGIGNNTTGLLTKNGNKEYFTGTYYNVSDAWEVADITANGCTRLTITSTGIACFACQVCAPAFIGGTVSGTTGTFSDLVQINYNNATSVFRLGTNTGGLYVIQDFYTNSARTGYIQAYDNNTTTRVFDLVGDTNIALRLGSGGATRLLFDSTGIACFACQVCMPVLLASGCILIGDTAIPDSAKLVIRGGNNSLRLWSDVTTDQPGMYVVTCNGSGNSNLYAKVYGAGIVATVFGQAIACKAILATEGACNTGLLFGTLNNAPIYVGTNSQNRILLDANGVACFACQVCAKSLWFSSNSTGQITFGSNDACNAYVVSDSNNALYLGNNNSYKIFVPNDGADMIFRTAQTYANPEERVRITKYGQLLINATSSQYGPNLYGYNLGVRGTNNQTFISIARANQTLDCQGIIFGLDTTQAGIYVFDNIPLAISTNNAERMRIAATGIACFACQVCTGAGLISNTLSVSCTLGDDRAMYMSLNCSANYNSGANNTIARSVNSLKFLWYNNCWEIGATRGDDTAIQALVFARQGNTYLAMTCHGIACFACQVCALNGFYTGDNAYLLKSSLRLRSSDNANYLDIQSTSTCNIISSNYGTADTPIILGTYTGYQCNQLFLATNCRVGIRTNSPAYTLDVSGPARAGTLLVSNATTTTWCVGRVEPAITDCWKPFFGWGGIYDGAFAIIQLGYEDNNGDGANAHALYMTSGAAYSTGFTVTQIGGATNLCLRRNGQCLEVLITGVDCRASGSYIGFTVQSMNVAS